MGERLVQLIFDPMTLGSSGCVVCLRGIGCVSSGGRMSWITAKRQLLINKWVISMWLSVRSTNRHLMRWNLALMFECRVVVVLSQTIIGFCGRFYVFVCLFLTLDTRVHSCRREILWFSWSEIDRIQEYKHHFSSTGFQDAARISVLRSFYSKPLGNLEETLNCLV